MESAGFVVGITGLAGTFISYVKCFDYIQLNRNFGADYGKCLLRLDAAKLRMSRWGESLRFESNSGRDFKIAVSKEEYKIAKSLLEQIMNIFEDAEKILKK